MAPDAFQGSRAANAFIQTLESELSKTARFKREGASKVRSGLSAATRGLEDMTAGFDVGPDSLLNAVYSDLELIKGALGRIRANLPEEPEAPSSWD